MLLSPTVQMHRTLRRAGVDAELHVFEAMPHGGLGERGPKTGSYGPRSPGF